MFNTVIFSVVVIVFRVGLGLGIAYAIYSTLIKHKSFFRAVYYMPVVTPMVAVAFVWKFMYNPQIGIINKIFGLDINWLMNVMEAAQVDGASGWQKFRYITLPLLKPMTLFVVITSIISYIQAYVQILIMTEGGPGTSTYLASYIIYDEAFVKYNFGYASALSFVLFVITAVLTVLSFKVSGKEE